MDLQTLLIFLGLELHNEEKNNFITKEKKKKNIFILKEQKKKKMMTKAHSSMPGYFMSKALQNPRRGFMTKMPPPNLIGRTMRLQPVDSSPPRSSLERY